MPAGLPGWARWLAGWHAVRLAGCVSVWLADSLAGGPAGWLASQSYGETEKYLFIVLVFCLGVGLAVRHAAGAEPHATF